MKKISFFLLVWLPLLAAAQSPIQWGDDFSDGNFTAAPAWSGNAANFIVNADKQLQSNAAATSKSYLSTPSEVFDDAVWEFWVKIDYNPSASNYAMVYIIADRAVLSDGIALSDQINGYYVQIGNSTDEISLYRQQGATRTKIIDGENGILNAASVEAQIRVTRSKSGDFSLFRKLPADTDWVQEGTVNDDKVMGSKYFGVLFSNSGATGKDYFFDNISVQGAAFLDVVPPVWTDLRIVEPSQLVLTFSEAVDISAATFSVNNGAGSPTSVQLSPDETAVTLTFAQPFERGKIYTVAAQGVKDLAGNLLANAQKQIGIVEPTGAGDVVINEILFDPATGVPEYFEIYNNSAKVLDLTTVFFTTRKADNTLNTVGYFPANTTLLPRQYLALTTNADTIREVYFTPDSANIINVARFPALSNSGANLLIASVADSTVLDEVRYDPKWHHALIRNAKGVALERVNPDMPSQEASSWHSAATDVHYGTPGYKNSQYRPIPPEPQTEEKWLYPSPEAFTPDNDGRDDICFIRYKTAAEGFTAYITVFNAVGESVAQLASGIVLGTEGYLVWDGRTDRGLNVNPGIYVLYAELINLETGVKKIEKMPIVVSAR